MMIVTDLKLVAFYGCEATLHGVGFSSDCVVEFGNGQSVTLIDADDAKIVFLPPSEGIYNAIVKNNCGEESNVFSIVVLNRSLVPVNRLPKRNAEDFALMLKGLLPRGFAWNFKWSKVNSEKTNWQKLLESIAFGIENVWDVLESLAVNASPVVTDSIDEWNAELGIPVKGIVDYSETWNVDEIYRVAIKRGGCTVPYLKGIAALFGKSVEIFEYWKNPEKFADEHFDDDPNFYLMVEIEANENDERVCTCEDTCEDFLRRWWNVPVEDFFEMVKPAHVKVLYSYVGYDMQTFAWATVNTEET